MYEIRVHGRGGQGVKTTARVLSRAAFLSGFSVQDFAVYGAERRGAPLASFCRIDEEDILERGYIFEPDAVIVLDDTIDPETCLAGVKKTGVVVLNANEKSGNIEGFRRIFPKIRVIDATRIALKSMGKPIPNIAVLGAFLRISGIFPFQNLKRAVRIELEESGHGSEAAGNLRACTECWNAMKRS